MKKKVYKVIAIVLALASIWSSNALYTSAQTFTLEQEGDADGNGVIEAADALEVLKATVCLCLPTPSQLAIADVNYDGELSAEDALIILKKVVKLIDEFPYDKNVIASYDRKYEELDWYKELLQNHLTLLVDEDGKHVTDGKGNACYSFHAECKREDGADCRFIHEDEVLENVVVSTFSVNEAYKEDIPLLILVDSTKTNKVYMLGYEENGIIMNTVTDQFYVKRDVLYVETIGSAFVILHPLGENPIESLNEIYIEN